MSTNTVFHKADTRGYANHGWLESWHTFSFAGYYNPQRMHFGALRVLNDDIVAPGKGFGKHAHDNMEIISIPLEGDLEHRDSMGNVSVIRKGEIQAMSAGTGVFHSEFNKNMDKSVKLLQIWVYPDKQNVAPRYQQITLDPSGLRNQWQQILSPHPDDEGVWIHQNAWFHLGIFDEGREVSYRLKGGKNQGVYAFLIEGKMMTQDQLLEARDGFGIWDIEEIHLKAMARSEILLMEVPMR